jgi:hypothetical protein
MLDVVLFVNAARLWLWFALTADATTQIHSLSVVLLICRHDLMAQHADVVVALGLELKTVIDALLLFLLEL